MKLCRVLPWLLCALLAACGGDGLAAMKPEVDLEIVNQSSCNVENARARFGENVCAWGRLVSGATKIYLYFPHAITAEAELHWDEPGGHRAEKIDLGKIYPRGKSGRLTFTLRDDRVETGFCEKSAPGARQ